ncbi:hypothetical protein QBC45DRAFT_61680 [Copromyces sp. CBS 386.78]|nr:hypothetical protein QBC45DRAFT_61680 [Copromyces sp. CBS 386.78]
MKFPSLFTLTLTALMSSSSALASHAHQLENRQTTGRCGANHGRCPNNLCCSDYGYCGDSVDHCYPGFDCQPAYGVCGWPRPVATTTWTTARPTSTSTSTSTTSTRPTTTTTSTTSTSSTRSTTRSNSSRTSSTFSFVLIPTGIITTNGQCGNSTICPCPGIADADAGWGPCCSQFFWCGSGEDRKSTAMRSETDFVRDVVLVS